MSYWYANENESWYAPLTQEEPTREKPKKTMRGWVKALIAVAVVICLIIGSALLFPNRSQSPVTPAVPEQKEDSNDSGFGQFIFPREDDDDTLPDDFRDFFEN